MKKFLLPFIILACALCCAVAASACQLKPETPPQTETGGDVTGGETVHTHEYTSLFVEPTCTEQAYTVYECECGDSYTQMHEDIPALGHDEIEHSGVAPTCTENGYKSYVTCSRCDYTTYETVAPLGHNLINHLGVAPTCTENGYKSYVTCSRCDYTTYETVAPLGHNLIYHSGVAASCTTDGYKDYQSCGRCDYTTYETVKALGHSLAEVPARQATCTQTGWDEYEKCLRCDFTTFEEIPMLEHSLEWHKERLYCVNSCAVCGYVGQTALHTFQNGSCTQCGQFYNSYLDGFNGKYGYEYLGTMPNGNGLQMLYSVIDIEVRNLHDSGEDITDDYCFAEINYSVYGIDMDDALKVVKTYRDDNPLYYWLSNTLVYTVEDIKLYVFEEYADGEVRTELNQTVYSTAGELFKLVGNESSAYMKALAFHDEIIQSIDYAYEGGVPQTASWAHSILGVLQGTGAVCEGYAKTFQLLLNLCGVENIYVTGESYGDGHAWNLVRLDDGNWYWYDVTWDDNPNSLWGITYNYCCATDAGFLKDHTPDSESAAGIDFLYGLPARAKTEYSGAKLNFKDTFTVNGLEYTVIGYNRVSVSKIEASGNVIIPEQVTYGGCEYSVIAIGRYNQYNYNEFSWCDINLNGGLASVFIPSTVRFIAYNTFYAITALKEINVATDNVNYSSLDGVLFTKSLDILICFPNAHKSVEYVIPEQTTQIGMHAFGTGVKQGKNLESLTVHANVRAVGVVNFGWGYGNVVTGEWNNIVNSLTGKKQLIIDGNNKSYKVKDGLIFNYDYTCVYASMPNTQDVVIPDTVFRMERDAFRQNHWIKSIVLPEGWNSIQDHQFTYCYELESIYIPDSVTSIGDSAFFGCEKLKSVNMPESLNIIGDSAFYNCGITNVIIPDGVTSIGKRAFAFCKNLLSVTLGTGLTEIGEEAFKDSDKLIEVYNLSRLEITAGSTENGYAGFYAANIFNNAQEQSKLTFTDDGYIFYEIQGTYLLVGYVGSETKLVLPDSYNGNAYNIYGYAFYKSNITEVVIPACVREIGEYAFYSSELVSVEIKEGVNTVGVAAFMWCESLNSVKIPASVNLIESYAFCACGDMNVYYAGSSSQWDSIIESGAFWETHKTLVYGK